MQQINKRGRPAKSDAANLAAVADIMVREPHLASMTAMRRVISALPPSEEQSAEAGVTRLRRKWVKNEVELINAARQRQTERQVRQAAETLARWDLALAELLRSPEIQRFAAGVRECERKLGAWAYANREALETGLTWLALVSPSRPVSPKLPVREGRV